MSDFSEDSPSPTRRPSLIFENQLRGLSLLTLNAAVSDNRQKTPETHLGTLSTCTSASSQVSPFPSPPNDNAHLARPQKDRDQQQQQQPTITNAHNENEIIKRDPSPSAAELKNLFETASAQAKTVASVTPRSPLSPSLSPHAVARPAVMAEFVNGTAGGQINLAGPLSEGVPTTLGGDGGVDIEAEPERAGDNGSVGDGGSNEREHGDAHEGGFEALAEAAAIVAVGGQGGGGGGRGEGGESRSLTANGINVYTVAINGKHADDDVAVSSNIPTEQERRRKDSHHGWSIRRESVQFDALFSPIAMPKREAGTGREGGGAELFERNAPVAISRRSLPWSGGKGGHASLSDLPEQHVADALMAKLRQTQLELMVTKEELSVEHGKRLKAQETCAQQANEIAMLTSNLEVHQKTVALLKELLENEQAARPASRHVVIEEERQLRLSRALTHFVLVCLQDKLQWLCVEEQVASSGSVHVTSRQLATLRKECASDLKSLLAASDVITALVSTRDNAGMSAQLIVTILFSLLFSLQITCV